MNLGCKECWIQPSCVRSSCLKLFKKGRSKKENCCSYLELFQLKVVFHPYATIVKGLLLSSVSRLYTVHSAFTLLTTTTYFDGEKRVSCREKLNGHFQCTTMVGFPNFGSTKYKDSLPYGNTGCGVFKRGVQNQKDFCLRINILKGNY